MANMSYCRFENTLNDMRACLNAMDGAENVSEMNFNEYELLAFERMADFAQELVEEIQRLQDGHGVQGDGEDEDEGEE